MSSPCHMVMILTRKQQVVSKAKEEVVYTHTHKLEETEEIKTHGLGVNSAKNTC